MKLIVAGSRTINDQEIICGRIYDFLINHEVDEFVLGACPTGPDEIAAQYARNHDFKIKLFPANWTKNGKSAGPIRNRQMAEYADHLLLIWNAQSKGSLNMKYEMRKLGKPITELIVSERTDDNEDF